MKSPRCAAAGSQPARSWSPARASNPVPAASGSPGLTCRGVPRTFGGNVLRVADGRGTLGLVVHGSPRAGGPTRTYPALTNTLLARWRDPSRGHARGRRLAGAARRAVPGPLPARGTALCRVGARGPSGPPGPAFPGREVAAWFPGGSLSLGLRPGPHDQAQGPLSREAQPEPGERGPSRPRAPEPGARRGHAQGLDVRVGQKGGLHRGTWGPRCPLLVRKAPSPEHCCGIQIRSQWTLGAGGEPVLSKMLGVVAFILRGGLSH